MERNELNGINNGKWKTAMANEILYWITLENGVTLGHARLQPYVPEGYKLDYDGKEYVVVEAKLRITGRCVGSSDGFLTVRLRGESVKPNLTISDIFDDGGVDLTKLTLCKARKIFERRYFSSQMKRFSGNVSRLAAEVGMERSAVHRKMRALELARPDKLVLAGE